MSETTPTTVSEIKKRSWQSLFNITVVLVGVAFVCGVFYPFSRQMNALRQFKRLGGTFQMITNAPTKPEWLRDYCDSRGGMPIGYVVFFGEVWGATFHGSGQPATSALQAIQPLPDILDLDLAHVQITEKDMELIKSFPKLRSLFLDYITITPNALKDLDQFPMLTRLSLQYVELTPSDFIRLAKLRRLSVLSLDGTPVTDREIRHLLAIPELRELSLGHTKITDAGLWELRKCLNLKELDVSYASVTKDGLTQFRNSCPDVRVFCWHTN